MNFDYEAVLIILLTSNFISNMIVNEDGAMSVFVVVRWLFGYRPVGKDNLFDFWKETLTTQSSDFPMTITNHTGKMISCIYCASVVVTFLTILVYYIVGNNVIFIGLSVLGLQYLIVSYFN